MKCCMRLVFGLLLLTACRQNPPDSAQLPPQAEPFLRQMQQALAAQQLAPALALADSVERYAPGWPDALFVRGLVYMQQRRYDAAATAFRQVLERQPHYPGAWFNLGQNAALARRYREAIGYYRKELKLAEEVSTSAQTLAAVWTQMGNAYEQLTRDDSARAAYAQALRVDSTYAEARAGLSRLLERAGRYEAALRHAEQAMALAPARLDYRYRAGALLVQLGRFAEAISLLQTVVQHWPGHGAAAYNLGRALIATGRTEAGQRYLARADSLQQLTEQLLHARRRTELQPDDPDAWSAYARLLMEAGYLDQAYTALQTALTLVPGNLALLSNLATLQLAMGDTTGALKGLQLLVRADSSFAEGWFNLGVVYAMLGDTGAARAAWQRTLRLNPEHEAARAYLGRLQ